LLKMSSELILYMLKLKLKDGVKYILICKTMLKVETEKKCQIKGFES